LLNGGKSRFDTVRKPGSVNTEFGEGLFFPVLSREGLWGEDMKQRREGK